MLRHAGDRFMLLVRDHTSFKMSYSVAIFINFILIHSIIANQFRLDYMWAAKFETFYKLHDLSTTWNKARQVCQAEGTSLLIPNSMDEMENLKILISNMKAHYTAIFIGLHDQFSHGQYVDLKGSSIFNTHLDLLWAEGRPDNEGGNEHCVIMNREGLFDDRPCDTKHPFLCKILLNETKYNKRCENYDMGYTYYTNGKCYKIHIDPLSWHDAYMVCNAEQGRLAIINSPKEASLVASFLGEYLDSQAPDPNIFLIGFSDLMFPYQYRTIIGQSLTEAGYSVWNPFINTMTNGSQLNINCGVISRTGNLDVMNCHVPAMFLCEKVVGTKATTEPP